MSDLSDVKVMAKPSLANVSLKNELVGLLSAARSSMTISLLYRQCTFSESESEVARALGELEGEGSVIRNGCGRYEAAKKAPIKRTKPTEVTAFTPPMTRNLTDADVVSLNDEGVLSIVFTDGLQVLVQRARLQRIAVLLSGFSKKKGKVYEPFFNPHK